MWQNIEIMLSGLSFRCHNNEYEGSVTKTQVKDKL